MKNKSEAIERFEFMKDIYDRVKNSGFASDKQEVDMCGVFFFKEYAYTTNNHIIGRIKVNDDQPMADCLYWSYREYISTKFNESFFEELRKFGKVNSVSCNIFEKDYAENLQYIFNRYTENYLYIRKSEWLHLIDAAVEREAIKAKSSICVTVEDNLKLSIVFTNNKGQPLSNVRVINSYIYPSERVRLREGSTFSVNAYYLYEILLHSFLEYDIIGLRFRCGELNAPVVLFGKNPSKPEIYWALAQTKVKKIDRV